MGSREGNPIRIPQSNQYFEQDVEEVIEEISVVDMCYGVLSDICGVRSDNPIIVSLGLI